MQHTELRAQQAGTRLEQPMRSFRDRAEVILIGPHRAGKSTLARLLGAQLGVPVISLDTIKWRYFAALGFDEEAGRRLQRERGFLGLVEHLKPYAISMVEQVLTEHQDCVFDFGAGHSMYEEAGHIARIARALAPFRDVALVLPSPDREESIRILTERSGPWTPDAAPYFDFTRYEVMHPCNGLLATLTVYTAGRTPAESCADLVQSIRRTTTADLH